MARRKRRKFGSSSQEHYVREGYAAEKVEDNARRAADLARRGICNYAVEALAAAEYWRGRRDAEGDGAGGNMPKRAQLIGKAHEAVSKCLVKK